MKRFLLRPGVVVQGSDIRLFTIVFRRGVVVDNRLARITLSIVRCRIEVVLLLVRHDQKKRDLNQAAWALACLLADWLVVCECNRPMIFSVGPLEDSFPAPLWSGPSFVDGEPRVLSD